MKLLPLILVLIILLPELRSNTSGISACHHTEVIEPDACHASEDKYACCERPADEDHSSDEENSCADGCSCTCCIPILLAHAPGDGPSLSHSATQQRKVWEVNVHSHEFPQLIWHPPRMG